MTITETLPALTDFLLARIAEDEDAATAVPAIQEWENHAEYGVRFSAHDSDHSYEDTLFLNRNSPARALAECEAKRRIIELRECFTCDMEGQECTHQHNTLVLLATVYADHPDFDASWAVSQ